MRAAARHPGRGAKAWGWNRSDEAPTFTPSILVYGWKSENPEMKGQPRCHSFVREGRIEYLSDSEHALAGQTFDLPNWEEWSGEQGAKA
jgi:hypothetical protein